MKKYLLIILLVGVWSCEDEKGNFPNAEMNAKECLSLPMYPELTNEMVEYVSEMIYKYFEKKSFN